MSETPPEIKYLSVTPRNEGPTLHAAGPLSIERRDDGRGGSTIVIRFRVAEGGVFEVVTDPTAAVEFGMGVHHFAEEYRVP